MIRRIAGMKLEAVGFTFATDGREQLTDQLGRGGLRTVYPVQASLLVEDQRPRRARNEIELGGVLNLRVVQDPLGDVRRRGFGRAEDAGCGPGNPLGGVRSAGKNDQHHRAPSLNSDWE